MGRYTFGPPGVPVSQLGYDQLNHPIEVPPLGDEGRFVGTLVGYAAQAEMVTLTVSNPTGATAVDWRVFAPDRRAIVYKIGKAPA